jgi:hypothetical protein
MPIKDNVNSSIIIPYGTYSGVAGPITGPALDLMTYGPILSVKATAWTTVYANDMDLEFQQSDDLAFTTPETITSNFIINPQDSFVLDEEITVVTEQIPAWGFIGIKRYFRITTTNGLGNSVIFTVEIDMTDKPSVPS